MTGRTWQKLADAALAGIYPALDAMTDSELKNIRSAKRKATNTNCWWVAYQALPMLSVVADDLLKHRQRMRRAARKVEA